jgi:uncharacterized membrane protein YesL
MIALKAVWQSIKNLYEDLMLLATIGLVWWVGTLLIVPGPAVNAGLAHVAHRIVHEERVNFSIFWQETRSSLGKAWKLAAVNLLALVLIATNILFYWQFEGWVRYVVVAWAYIALLWLAMQLYLFPLLYEMETPRLTWLLRNALLMPLFRPGYTLLTLLLLLLVTALSIAMPFLLVTVWPSLLALVSARTTASAVQTVAERRAKMEEQEDEEQ